MFDIDSIFEEANRRFEQAKEMNNYGAWVCFNNFISGIMLVWAVWLGTNTAKYKNLKTLKEVAIEYTQATK